MSDPTKRSDWGISPLPIEHGRLPVELSFTPSEFAKLTRGRMPHEYGDKWFIFFEEPWLYCHRAMTGACMFQVRIEADGDRYCVREALVDRCCSTDDDNFEEKELSLWLSGLLLSQAGRATEARVHSDRMSELRRRRTRP